jgi:site-specific DNA recombinase
VTIAVRSRARAAQPTPATVRVAVYTRKSVSEGLDMEFNSLDAQREAVESYVKSQRGEGWAALPEHYDDGGFTGANTDRPAFQRLLADVEAGRVDIVATYKTDRLSRSLADFTRLMELFERQGVAFVSVTERFDTSNPMGRMAMNILATFAQFERETIAQRVRDKVRATQRRGMWTGGRPVLGYDLVEKKLVVNAEEAERVRSIFALYHELGSLLAVVEELSARGWTTKSWRTKAGVIAGGRPFTKNTLHDMLRHPLYLGKIRCGDEIVAGQHEAIVDQDTWAATQALLSGKSVTPRGWRPPTRNGAVLKGLISCSCGASMLFHSAHRHEKQYGYYVCARALKQGAKACPGSRAPAGQLEEFVVERIRGVGRDPAVLEATLAADRADRERRRPELQADVRKLAHERGRLESERENIIEAIASGGTGLVTRLAELDADIAEVDQRAGETRRDLVALDRGLVDPEDLRRALADLEPVWAELFPKERARVLALLLERVVFDPESGEVAITFRTGGPRLLAAEKTTCGTEGTSPCGRQVSLPTST